MLKKSRLMMNKYFVIGLITAFVGFGIYDIKKKIEVKRKIERNKKIRQEKYDRRVRELNKRQWLANIESAYIQGLITLEEYEKNEKELEHDKD